jgi:hypothetical protein
MKDTLVKLIGWKALMLQGDPTVVDRWRWLKQHVRPGPLRTLDAGCGTGAFTHGLDTPLTWLARYPYLSVGVVGRRPV